MIPDLRTSKLNSSKVQLEMYVVQFLPCVIYYSLFICKDRRNVPYYKILFHLIKFFPIIYGIILNAFSKNLIVSVLGLKGSGSKGKGIMPAP